MQNVKVYTLDEVANIMQVTKRTLYTYIQAGVLHAVKFGKSWRVSERDLDTFISTGTSLDPNKQINPELPAREA